MTRRLRLSCAHINCDTKYKVFVAQHTYTHSLYNPTQGKCNSGEISFSPRGLNDYSSLFTCRHHGILAVCNHSFRKHEACSVKPSSMFTILEQLPCWTKRDGICQHVWWHKCTELADRTLEIKRTFVEQYPIGYAFCCFVFYLQVLVAGAHFPENPVILLKIDNMAGNVKIKVSPKHVTEQSCSLCHRTPTFGLTLFAYVTPVVQIPLARTNSPSTRQIYGGYLETQATARPLGDGSDCSAEV